jgi:hypothetical protein
MRRSSVFSSVLLGSLLLSAPSCKVQVGSTAQPATGSNPAKEPAQTEAQANDEAKRTSPASNDAAQLPVWGHFVLATPDKTLGRIGDRIAPPGAGAMLSPEQVATMVAMGLGGREGIRTGLDLSQPLGCVLVNPKTFDDPLVCAVGYGGGLPRFIEDMGQEGYVSGGPDFAAYNLEGDTYYFKGWGNHVAVAREPSLLASVETPMRDMVINPGKADRDVYVEAYPAVIMADAREEVERFYAEMEREMQKSPGGGDYGSFVTDMYRSFADLDAAEFVFKIGKNRTRATYRGVAHEGTPTAEQYARDAKLAPVDLGLIDTLPDEAFFVGGASFDFANLRKDPWMAGYFRMFEKIKLADGTPLGTMMKEMFDAMGEAMEGPTAFAVFPQKGTAGVMGAVYAMRPGADVVSVMRKMFRAYKPEEVIPQLKGKMTSVYKENAFSVGGAKVDTYTFKPSQEILAELRKDAGFSKFRAAIGKAQVVMAMAQKDDRYYLVVTTDKPKKAMARMLSAASGKGNLGKFGDARKRVKKNADGYGLAMLDVKGAMAWARSLDVDGELDGIPNLGVALDDVVWTLKVNKKGKKQHQLSVSQPFVDQVRSQ